MTQVKKSLSKKQKAAIQAAQSLRNDYLALSDEQKNLMQDFFNLHSAAIHFYELLSEEAKQICDEYVNLSQKNSVKN